MCAGTQIRKRRIFSKVKQRQFFEDIVLLNLHLDATIETSDDDSLDTYVTLVKSLLAKIILFNRCGAQLVQELRWASFHDALISHAKEYRTDVLNELHGLVQFAAKRIFKMDVAITRGVKRILFTEGMLHGMKCLQKLSKRYVHPGVDYIFARPGMCATPFVGGVVLKEAAKKAGVTDSDMFTSTNIRKQMEIMAKGLDVAELRLVQDHIAKFFENSPEGPSLNLHEADAEGILLMLDISFVL